MSTNKDLLKQAIAEAKTIREAAIANAKEALEESLTPHLKNMLAAKLQEMEEAEEEVVNEEDTLNNPEGITAHGNVSEAEEEEAEEEESEEGEEEDIDIKDMSVEELKDLIRDIVSQEVGHDESEEEIPQEDDMTGMDSEEEIDINEILAELAEMEEVEEGLKDFAKKAGEKIKATVGPGGSMEKWIDKSGEKLKKAGITGHGMTKGHRAFQEEVELKEAIATVAELRAQLQEVNLLNAKLLYVNKVFKANNLTESQKVNVVAAFDKAETVREVKLVYETVSKNVVTKPVTIKEHKSFASKSAGTASTAGKKEVISEVNEQVARWQKLAGIIK